MQQDSLIIAGSGGGGKDGGGGAQGAVEAPNTLKSIQYARVLDLASEGEIEGLVNGLESVLINDTPLMNSSGTLNFSGVTFYQRLGTQSQTHIEGFPSIENEVPVSVEIKKDVPTTISISNPEIDAARITVSIPALTVQNTSTGDLNGTSVTLQVYLQNNYGGFFPVELSTINTNLQINSNIASSGTTEIYAAELGISWVGTATKGTQSCTYTLEYRQLPSSTWVLLSTETLYGTGIKNAWLGTTAPTGVKNYAFSGHGKGIFEFRLTKTSGVGTVSFSRATAVASSPSFTISGKTTSPYQVSKRIELPSPGPWDIKLVRVTNDAATSNIQNKTYFDTYTEIIDAKLSYPNSALFGITIDASQFTSIPSRAYEVYGIKVKVPTNYNPKARTYTGEWTGDFKIAWTNNPAWVLYDLITNDRYGLGEFISSEHVDKWGLYSIAQYCDELVDDGLGSLEPRFTCNVYIQSRSEAFELVNKLTSVFRAIAYWSAGQIVCVQDKPADVVAQFTSANVIDGQFGYSGSSVKARHTVCLVTWNDPKNRYKQKVEYVEDEEGIARYGVIQTEIQAFGCTSRGQAHRLGKWLLFSERMETETITFKAGMDAAKVYPGAIIQTQDQFRSGKRFGGRLKSGSSQTELILDSEIEVEAGKTYEISVLMPNGDIVNKGFSLTPGNYSSITLSSALDATPITDSVWVISASDLVPETWRVINIAEVDSGIVEITALSSRQDKYDAVEKDLVLTTLPTTSISSVVNSSVSNIDIKEAPYLVTPTIVGNSATISWSGNSTNYLVGYYSDSINPVYVSTINTSHTFYGIAAGKYTFTVCPTNSLGAKGQTFSLTKEIFGLISPPSSVTGFNMAIINGMAHVSFNPATDLDVRIGGYMKIRHSLHSNLWNNATDINVHIPGTATSAVVPLMNGTYLAKWVDSSGIESINAVSIITDSQNLINRNVVESVEEHPDYSGTRTNIKISSFLGQPCLSLDSLTEEGEYIFTNEIDLGEVLVSRLYSNIVLYGINENNFVDSWPNLDSLKDIDAQNISGVTTKIFVKSSQDAVTYTDWLPLIVGDYSARAFKFKLVVSTINTDNVAITECGVIVDMPDIVYSSEDITSNAGVTSVVYPKKFRNNPAISITAQDMQTGDFYVITNKTDTGFDIEFKNSSGTSITRTFDYLAKGY